MLLPLRSHWILELSIFRLYGLRFHPATWVQMQRCMLRHYDHTFFPSYVNVGGKLKGFTITAQGIIWCFIVIPLKIKYHYWDGDGHEFARRLSCCHARYHDSGIMIILFPLSFCFSQKRIYFCSVPLLEWCLSIIGSWEGKHIENSCIIIHVDMKISHEIVQILIAYKIGKLRILWLLVMVICMSKIK